MNVLRRSLAAVSASFLVALSLWGAGPASASAEETRWSVVPADADGPDGRISLRHEIEPGGHAQDAIAITNHSATAATFDVAAGDGVIGDGGAFDIAPGEPQDSGAWIVLEGADDGAVSVPAGETRIVPLTIAVPENATPGDHPAGIVVGVSSEEGGTTVTNRVGVRVHLQVAGEIAAAIELDDVEVRYAASIVPFALGTVTVDYEVRNVGNVRLGAAVQATSAGPFGLLTAEGSAEAVELLPGDTATGAVSFPAWPSFVLFSDVDLVGVAVGEDAVELPAVQTLSATAFAVSWSGVLLLAVLMGAAVVVIRRRRPVRREESPEGGECTRRCG